MPGNFNKYQYQTSPRKLEPEYAPKKNTYKGKKSTTKKQLVKKTNNNKKGKRENRKEKQTIKYITIGFIILFAMCFQNAKIDENFEKTNKTFTSVLERLSKIDEAQKKIDNLSSDIISLQSVLTDKKTRGIFGEVNLNNILSNVFGENNKRIYQLQYQFDNTTIADCVLFAPDPLGTIAIDSKFPLENYQIMVDKNNSPEIRQQAERLFKQDVKKHIDAISSKYIIPGVTSNQAIMFLPAEAIFAEINAYHQDILQYSYKKRVWITSPTTLISTLTTIQVIIKNMERDKYAKVIHQELRLLDVEFKRYKDRWDKLYRSIETVSKDVKEIHTTTDKITKRFDSINQVEIVNNKQIEEIID